jgi:hypothetical protein
MSGPIEPHGNRKDPGHPNSASADLIPGTREEGAELAINLLVFQRI